MQLAELIGILKSKYGRNFRQDNTSHWRVEVMTQTGRSQVVFLIYKENIVDGKDVSRLIAESPIGPVSRHFNPEVVLRKNAHLDVGTICINDLRNEEHLIVSYLTLRASHLVPTAQFEEIWEMIEKVGRVADELEEEVYGKDFH